MRLLLTNTGSYPRIGEAPEQQEVRRTLAARERGDKTAEDLGAAEDAAVRAAIEDQVRAGLDLVTDGQIRWYDSISHLAGKLTGIEILQAGGVSVGEQAIIGAGAVVLESVPAYHIAAGVPAKTIRDRRKKD